LSPGNQYFQNLSATEHNTIEAKNDNVTQQYEHIMIRVDKTTPASVWLKSVRSLTQIRIKKIYHQHARGLVGMFFKRQSVYLWVQPVLLFSPSASVVSFISGSMG
jgi:hypothetical protein